MEMSDLRFDERGLIPAVAQDADNGEVLMVAAMTREALERTVVTGLAHYYSRSRGRLWQKGEESGHVQRVHEILYDCDADVLLLKVSQEVAACHTGHRSCFYRRLLPSPGEVGTPPVFDPARVYGGTARILDRLFATIQDRRARQPEGSYVASLFQAGQDRILKKVAEETAETLLASKGGKREEILYEVADLWFHTLVLLAHHGLGPGEVAGELERRFGQRPEAYRGRPRD